MDLKISDMMQLQQALYEKHKDKWEPREPESGRSHILYMIEEIGEMISILKKKGDSAVLDDSAVRSAFVEEMADVMMYLTDVLLCFHISAEEFSEAFCKKANKNMERDYAAEYKELYHG